MTSLVIAWEYLTGYSVATDPADRERAEWPPHPGRVFMALAAAWFETDENPAEGAALRWLESLGEPELHVPAIDAHAHRSSVTVYVPVNDKAGPAAATLQSAPALTRSKQPRTFPRVYVGHAPCAMVWGESAGLDEHREALERLCGKVTRIGHSSSLVHMWVADEPPTWSTVGRRLTPKAETPEHYCRRFSTGLLDLLEEQFGEGPRQRHAQLIDQAAGLKAERKAAKGKGASERKAEIDQQLAAIEGELAELPVHPPVRPTLGVWSGYGPADRDVEELSVAKSHFDADMLVLSHVDGPQLPVTATLQVVRALRGAVMSNCDIQPIPSWVSGHRADGQPNNDDDGHLAIVPLPFIGHRHADGRLLGMGLAFPQEVSLRERGKLLGKLLTTDQGEPRNVPLKLGRLGVWTLERRHWSDVRQATTPETWTAHPEGDHVWASATPVVLDKFPKSDRAGNLAQWRDEVAEIVIRACQRIGLPTPNTVDIDTTCWLMGGPRAIAKQRRVRGGGRGDSRDEFAAMGDGFPTYPAKSANAARPQVHVRLEFEQPIVGPVLLGAGRYHGYGLCKPIQERRR